jgi:pimeloyl-ACP methyl ester carboxylesterase
VQANGVELCVETFGDPGDPAILLIMGAGASMLGWEEEFCVRLAAGPRFVIRCDHRDTGRSVHYEPGAPQYSMHDLVEDAVGVLDSCGLASAHLVGMSMGGGIGQLVALDHPERVASLTLISPSPGPGDPDLPAMSEELRAHFAGAAVLDWSDRAAVIDYSAESARPYAGKSRPFDEAAWRDLARREFDRAANIESRDNHFVIEGSGS